MSGYPCPHCGDTTTKVTDCRVRGLAKQRTRRCTACESAFYTNEITQMHRVQAIKEAEETLDDMIKWGENVVAQVKRRKKNMIEMLGGTRR